MTILELDIHPEQILASVTHPDLQTLKNHFLDNPSPYIINMEQDIDALRVTSRNVYLGKEFRDLPTAETVLTQLHSLGVLYAHENLTRYKEAQESEAQEDIDYRMLVQGNMRSYIQAGNLLLRVLAHEQKPETENDWRRVTDLISRTTQWADSFDIEDERNKLHNNRAIMFRLRNLSLPTDESKGLLDTLLQLQGKLIGGVLHPSDGKSIPPAEAHRLLVDYYNNRGVVRDDLATCYESSMPDQTIAQLHAAATDFGEMIYYLGLPIALTDTEKQTQRAKAYSNLGYVHLHRSRFLFEQPDSIEFSEGDFTNYIDDLTEATRIVEAYDDARSEIEAELWRRRAEGILLLTAVQRSIVRLPSMSVREYVESLFIHTGYSVEIPQDVTETTLQSLVNYCLAKSEEIMNSPDDILLYRKTIRYRDTLFSQQS